MDIKKARKLLRNVAIHVSKFTGEIADKLEDKEKQPDEHSKEDTTAQAEVKSPKVSETSETKSEENIVLTQSGTKEEDTRDALNESIEKRNEDKDVNIDDKSVFLIDGEDYVEKAEEKKHDIQYMKKCCLLELQKMKEKNEVPSPFYFERVAILSKKDKNYEQEVKYCEDYIEAVDEFYTNNKDSNVADIRKTTKYHSLVKRMEKAKNLISKN